MRSFSLLLLAFSLAISVSEVAAKERVKKQKVDEGYYSSMQATPPPTVAPAAKPEEDGYYATIPAAPATAPPSALTTAPAPPPPPAVPDPTAAPVPAALGKQQEDSIKVIDYTKGAAPVERQLSLAKPTMANAMKLFNDRKYGQALGEFERLDRNGQCNERVHYYIARCCQQNAQVARAQNNYAWVIQYGKDPTLKQYARTAYIQLARYSQHRTYDGNGNFFSRFQGGPAGGGGGGG